MSADGDGHGYAEGPLTTSFHPAASERPEGPSLEHPPGDPETAERRKWRGIPATIIEIVVIVTAAFVIALLVQAFLVKPFTIHQVSMRPTLEEGDRILLNRLTFHFREPGHGDVVVFHSPINADEDLVKRIVGVAGERLAIHDGRLWIDGVAQDEPYLLDRSFEGEMPEVVVPDGEVFVMGDNRNNSGDSRLFGPVSKSVIIGKAFAIYWPVGHWKSL